MTNRLADTLSPYLRAHADNPVDWYPWGAEAFEQARVRDVPLLISIGYSTCHWCHVMARESFSDPHIAAMIAGGFVAVKVDREEHPDVDGAYMAAASAFTRNLGWPLTVFATPQGRTFYAGTYWPAEARAQMPAFRDVLTAVGEAWTLRRAQAIESADAVNAALIAAAAAVPSELPDTTAIIGAASAIVEREDSLFGGFGAAPKFPVATTLSLLQAPLVRREAPSIAGAAERALAAMTRSPLRDEDGGFFRYATQRDWSVPHYERMLTDNAQLLEVARAAGDEATARGIVDFLLGTLRGRDGAFRAAQDSESWIEGERSEGGYYRSPVTDRASLAPPAVDGKVITGWNGLAIGALARAGAFFGETSWIDSAAEAATVILDINRDSAGALARASLDGAVSQVPATAGDVSLLADGLFALAAATGDVRWAIEGRRLTDTVRGGSFGDPQLFAHGVATAPDQTDGDLPSAAAALAGAAMSAWRLGAGESYRATAAATVGEYITRALGQPFAHGSLLRAAAGLVDPPRQIVVVTDDRGGPLASAARRTDADVVVVVTSAQATAFADAGFELFEGKGEGKGEAREAAFDCRSFVCRLPVSDASGLARDR